MKTFTEKLMGFVAKRDAAVRSYRKCINCGSEHVYGELEVADE